MITYEVDTNLWDYKSVLLNTLLPDLQAIARLNFKFRFNLT